MDNLAIDNGVVFGGCMNINSSPCIALASGKIFYDFNENGEQDENEIPLSFAGMEDENSGSLFFSNQNGHWTRCLDEGNTTISIIEVPDYFLAVPPSHTLDLSEGDEVNNLDFALQPDGIHHDLSVNMFNIFPDRPGFSNEYTVEYNNIGNTCVDDISLEITLDERLTIDSLSAADYSITDNTIIINAGELCFPESGSFQIFHTLDDTVSIGSILQSDVSISSSEEDQTPENNSLVFESEVFGAYDPNDKWVDKEEITPQFITDDKKLEYRIRFQNTGNFFAERVVITDEIDENLDLSTLEILSYSHDMELSVEGRTAFFTFDEIFLPDSSSNEAESHGFVRFRIAPNDDLSLGDFIDNTAAIYFDFNEPIITNTVTTTVVDALSLKNFEVVEPRLYPNPAVSSIQISWPVDADVKNLAVFDITGKVVLSTSAETQNGQILLSIEALDQGVYTIQFSGNTPLQSKSFIKM
jgi:hypothetical protein